MENDFISTPAVPKFYFLNPNPKDIHISDIAHALSLTCRFGGHCSVFYSVAEHSIKVAEIVEGEGADKLTVMAALLHDAEETYLPDIPRPIKAVMSEAQDMYEKLEIAVINKFHLLKANWEHVDNIDRRLCITEAKALGVWNEEWEDAGPYLNVQLHLWSSADAEELFLRNFHELSEALYDYVLRS